MDLLAYMVSIGDRIVEALIQHLWLAGVAVGLGTLVGVPLGIFLTRAERVAQPILGFAGVLRTIPSLALLGFMMPVFGIGNPPAIAALFLYSLLPILRNTYTGIRGVDPVTLEAAKGMGMTDRQMLALVQLPIALPVIMSGIRTSTVTIVGWATVAAFIGGGGLGQLIFTGLVMNNNRLLLAGAIPSALLAILVDYFLGYVENRVTPKGLKVQRA
ncbi:MAG TPA: ABC transporter permease [Clostridia bacterium]|nr:ABC transporter permease [Clostridia bacterium]